VEDLGGVAADAGSCVAGTIGEKSEAGAMVGAPATGAEGAGWLWASCAASALQNEIASASAKLIVRRRHMGDLRLTIGVAPGFRARHGPIVSGIVLAGIFYPTRFGCMASIRAIERREVCSRARSLVAGLASSRLVRNFPIRMRECRTRPCCGVVAGGASARGRETISRVVRHRSAERGGALPLCGVAAVAICGRRR
jgi:hypothetical protein